MRRVGSAGDGPGGDGAAPVDGQGRTVLVIGDNAELAVALRDRLDRAYVTVCEVRHAEAEDAVSACRPWPWMAVGEGDTVPPGVARALAAYPIVLLWRGAPPDGLPAHARGFTLFSELAVVAEAAVTAEAGGVRLAPGAGLTMPDGEHAGNAALEALVATHPHPLFAPSRHFRSAAAILAAHRVPLRVTRTPSGGTSLAFRGP